MTRASTSTLQSKNHPQHSYSSNPAISSSSTRSSPYPPNPDSTSPNRTSGHGGPPTGSIFHKLLGCFSTQRKQSSPLEKQQALLDVPPFRESNDSTATSDARPRRSGEEFEKVFRYFDENGDGKISPSELRNCMRAVGEELSAEEAEAVVESTDSDGDGLLGFEDFVKLVEVGGEEEKTRDLREAFGMYEVKGRGCITPKSLRQMLRRLGDSKTVEECKAMIQRYDLNGDGVLSFDEFKVMML
uniref:Putative calcium-binding protein CML31 n=1 Tax=Anthurium amnicola TaxID=1678845 RepID=A0A1D1Y6I9_9ARAE